jgi:hypothetical protein
MTRPLGARDRSLLVALGVMLLAAGAGAGLAAVGVPVVSAPAPRDALHADLLTVVLLVGHNEPVALWPLALVALGWPRIRYVRVLGDALMIGQLAGHGALVGSAPAQHPELWRYLPHLPAEWLALALPVAAWAQARAGRCFGAAGVVAVAGRVVVLLVLAAVAETYLVPLP